jgi:nucleoside-diphosphate-sugar epimerase
MNILLTGGAGFIGSHVSESLLGTGHAVTIVDELNDFYSPDIKRANLAAVRRAGSITFHKADVCNEERMLAIGQGGKFDAIIHLAARAGVRPSLEQPLLYERVNVRGTMELLEMAKRCGIGKFIFASSSSIYGIGNTAPFSETDDENKPISPYAATKVAGEKIHFTYSHLYGIRTCCLRFFTVYGPRQRPDLAIHKFADLIEQDCGCTALRWRFRGVQSRQLASRRSEYLDSHPGVQPWQEGRAGGISRTAWRRSHYVHRHIQGSTAAGVRAADLVSAGHRRGRLVVSRPESARDRRPERSCSERSQK